MHAVLPQHRTDGVLSDGVGVVVCKNSHRLATAVASTNVCMASASEKMPRTCPHQKQQDTIHAGDIIVTSSSTALPVALQVYAGNADPALITGTTSGTTASTAACER
jgi:hypothetical protein